MASSYNEETVELAALEWLRGHGFETAFGPDIAPETPGAQRGSYQDVVLDGPLRAALVRLNPAASPEAVTEAFRQLSSPVGVGLQANQGGTSAPGDAVHVGPFPPTLCRLPGQLAISHRQNSITEVTPV